MRDLLLASVLIASIGITSSFALTLLPSRTLQELRSKVDAGFIAELDGLLDAQPGNPRDVEIWKLIKHFGLLRFLQQARIQIGIASATLQLHPEYQADQLNRFKGTLVSLGIALAGCGCECIAVLFNPHTTRMQAVTAAEIFSWLHIDVEDLCAGASA
jgi:hypothetical protein